VEVHRLDGEPLKEKVTHPLGEPENPLPLSATREKFRREAGDVLSKKSMEKMEGLLDVSGMSEPAESLFEILAGP
jgi:2-methylcitrate dehydratase PrpD